MGRRKIWIKAAVKVALILVVLDLIAYLAVYRSVNGMLSREQQRFTAQRIQWRRQQAASLRVERRAEALPAAERQVSTFVEAHVPRRREGYSRAAVLVENLTRRSGVELAGIAYKKDDDRSSVPFRRLTLSVYVQGPFNNLLNFGHGLETASDFIVVRSFKFESSGEGMLGLRLSADLYLMP